MAFKESLNAIALRPVPGPQLRRQRVNPRPLKPVLIQQVTRSLHLLRFHGLPEKLCPALSYRL
jgi:hypothetical protein